MVRWALLNRFDNPKRFQFLAQYLKEKHNFDNELVERNLEMSSEGFFSEIETYKQECDQIRVGPPYGALLAENMDQSNAITMTVQSADCLHKVDGKWWPRSLLEECLLRAFIRGKYSIDIHSKAMIIGTGAMAKACITSLVKLGYNSISFTDLNEEKGYDFIRKLKNRVFGVNFEFIPQKDIALLPGVYTTVINTTPDIDENQLVDNLSFFNYLKSGGIAADLSVSTKETKFIRQANLVEAQILAGYKIAAELDAYWCEMCFDIELNVPEYSDELFQFLKKEAETH